METELRTRDIPVPQIVGLLVFGMSLWVQVGDAYVGRFLEDGLLLVLGKSIARGDGLTFLHLPGSPAAHGVPPLYPVFLGVVGRIWPSFPDNVILIQILDSGLLGVAAWMMAAGASSVVQPYVAGVVVLLGFMSMPVLSLAVSAFSEPLLLALATGAVLLANRSDTGIPAAVGTGLMAGLAVLTHRLGPCIVIGVTLGFVARRELRLAGIALLTAVVVWVPWAIWSATQLPEPTPLAAIALAASRTSGGGGGGSLGLQALVGQLLPDLPGWLLYPMGSVAVLLAVAGIGALWKTGPALPLTLGISLLGASFVDDAPSRWRYVLFPWFWLSMCFGASWLWHYRRDTRVAVAIAGGMLALAYVPRTITNIAQRQMTANAEMPAHDDLTRLVYTIAQETPEDAVIASDADAMIHLYTARHVVPWVPGDSARHESIMLYLCRNGVTHIARVGLLAPSDAASFGAPDSAIESVFELTDGPALYELRCPP